MGSPRPTSSFDSTLKGGEQSKWVLFQSLPGLWLLVPIQSVEFPPTMVRFGLSADAVLATADSLLQFKDFVRSLPI